MADFERSYLCERSPEDLWRVINAPLLDPDIASLVLGDDLSVSYEHLDPHDQIGSGTRTTYAPTEAARQKVAPVYRYAVPRSATFFVCRMSPEYTDSEEALRHEVLMDDWARGSVTRTVEPEGGGSRLVVAATLAIDGIGSAFDRQIEKALGRTFGDPSERTIALAQDILATI